MFFVAEKWNGETHCSLAEYDPRKALNYDKNKDVKVIELSDFGEKQSLDILTLLYKSGNLVTASILVKG